VSQKFNTTRQIPRINSHIALRIDICCIRSVDPINASSDILNDLVSRYLPNTAFTITRTPSGKPLVNSPHLKLSVSVSHTGTFLCIAIANTTAVGIDIERIDRHIHHPNRLVKRCFTPALYREFIAGSTASQHHRFQTGWTKFEAYVKCHGSGVFHPIPNCDHLWDRRPSYTTDTTLWPICIHPHLVSCIAYPSISGTPPAQFKLIYAPLIQQSLPAALPITPLLI
jgi:phosphopantetheinyl transferase